MYDRMKYYYICAKSMYKYFNLESFKNAFSYLFTCVRAKLVLPFSNG